MVQVLQPTSGTYCVIPLWVHPDVERGYIVVATQTRNNNNSEPTKYVVLFHLACDARTRMFVGTFCRSADLLQLFSSNEVAASETAALRMVKLAKHKRRAAADVPSTGRLLKDTFEGLARSMNILGTKQVWEVLGATKTITMGSNGRRSVHD